MDRKFAMTRVRAGDYLLLSNDEQTLWRIVQYTEDGSAVTDAGRELRGQFWSLWRFKGDKRCSVDLNEWNDFEQYDSLMKTRGEAVQAALKSDEQRTGVRP